METDIECVCCQELNEIEEEKFEGIEKLITHFVADSSCLSSFLFTFTSGVAGLKLG